MANFGAAASDLGTAVSDFGAAIGDGYTAAGDLASASAYTQAAKYATEDYLISQNSGGIELAQNQMQVTSTLGSQRADVAAAGFQNSGSALNLLASSAQQGALTSALISDQTAINVTGYQAQAAAYTGEATAAQNAAKAAKSGGLFSEIGGAISTVAGIFSL